MRIFINYRRGDSPGATQAIDKELRFKLGGDTVFRDIDEIPLGSDFAAHIERALSNTDVMLVVIGPRWVSPRLGAEGDYVRLEIEAALKLNISIIPVLVDHAKMPTLAQVPTALTPLVRRNGIEIDFGPDVDSQIARLVEGIKRAVIAARGTHTQSEVSVVAAKPRQVAVTSEGDGTSSVEQVALEVLGELFEQGGWHAVLAGFLVLLFVVFVTYSLRQGWLSAVALGWFS